MSLPLFWIIFGTALCLMEMVLPTAFIEAVLGLSAYIVAIVALIMPSFSLQVGLWMILSLLFTFSLKRLVPKRTPHSLAASTEARTLTAIAPGRPGRVLYEGNSWQARCEDETLEISVDEPVIVLGRKGNTLYVVPERLLS